MFALSVRLSVQAAHDFRQPFEEEICIIATEAQRRTDLQAVAKATGRANQHALKLQVIDNATRQLRIRLSAVWRANSMALNSPAPRMSAMAEIWASWRSPARR